MEQKEIVKKQINKGKHLKFLLENYPLFRKMKEYVGEREEDLSIEPLQLNCPNPKCRGDRTYSYLFEESNLQVVARKNPVTSSGIRIPTPALKGKTYSIVYKCNSCSVHKYYFLITFGDGYLKKSGQEPNPAINVEKEIEEKLGKELSQNFKNARICEEHGLGIGAVAYYRRVIEDKINDLLDEMVQSNTEVDQKELAKMVEQVKARSTFDDKSKMISDSIPAMLKPGGHNLIKILFCKLSEGLHSKDNEVCIEIAHELRDILKEVILAMNTQKRVTARMSEIAKKLNS